MAVANGGRGVATAYGGRGLAASIEKAWLSLTPTEVVWPGACYGGVGCEDGVRAHDAWSQKAASTDVSIVDNIIRLSYCMPCGSV